MTSALAVDVWVLIGACVQCALILRARRFKPGDAALALGLLCAMPLLALLSMAATPRADRTIGLAFIGLGLGVICAGFYVMNQAPARLTTAGLVSLTATFWIALRPEHPLSGWNFLAALLSAGALVAGFGPWRPPRAARLLLYLWFLFAAAAVAATELSGEAVYALILRAADAVSPLTIAEAVLTGAQAFLLVQFSAGLMMAIPSDQDDRAAKFEERLVDSYDDERLGWKAAVAIAAQTAVLVYARSRGGASANELVGLAAILALAHGAMTGDAAATRTPSTRRRGRTILKG